MGQSKPFGAFDQNEIDFIDGVLKRAWEVVSHTDSCPDEEARRLLALCVLAELRLGEKDSIRLVDHSIMQFRALRSHEPADRKVAQV